MRGKIRAMLSALLCLALCLGSVGAAGSRDLTSQEGQAMRLERLGLFLGVGEDGNGFTDFDLDRAPSREEAVTMLVRALGKGAEAAGMEKTHPFTDVPAWADGYVSYAYAQGLTKGISDTAFGAGDTATGAMYVTFMLRALNYVDGADFTWDDPWALAEDCGILPQRVDRETFLRADAVDVTAAALSAKLKGTDTTLAQKLIAEGAVSQAAWDQAFQTYEAAMERIAANDLYQEKQRWESDYGTVVLGYVAASPMSTGYTLQLVTKPAAAVGEGLVIGLPLDNKAAPTEPVLSDDGRTFTYKAGILGLRTVDLSTVRPPEQPAAGAGTGQDAYEAAMEQIAANDFYREEERWESDYGTVVLGLVSGLPSGNGYTLQLVTKEAAAVGEGVVIDLPLPNKAAPEEPALSADGQTFTYTIHLEETVTVSSKTDLEGVTYQAGTYTYMVELRSGKVASDIRPTEPTPEEEQAAYDAAIAQRTQGVTVLERLESDYCTVLYTSASDAKGERLSLILVFKPGSAKGAGETVNVGLPSITDTIQAEPEGMALSADGKTLTFTCVVDERSTGQQVGTYHYTITLETGAIRFEVADR